MDKLRSIPGQKFLFEWNNGALTDQEIANGHPAWPGDTYVDIIGTDVYESFWNIPGMSGSYGNWGGNDYVYPPLENPPNASHAELMWNQSRTQLDSIAALAAKHGKRIALSEWGVQLRYGDAKGGGDDASYIQRMHDWIATHDVAYEATFNGTDDNKSPTFLANAAVPAGATSLVIADGRRAYPYGGSIIVGSQELTYTRVALSTNKQVVWISGAPTTGGFTLTFGGKTTPVLAYNAGAAAVQSALQALSSVGAGNVTVSGSAGGPYLVSFVGGRAGTTEVLTATSSLGGGSSPGVSTSPMGTLTGIPTSGAGRVRSQLAPWTRVDSIVKQRFKLAVSPVADAPTVGGDAENGANGTFGDSPFFPRSAAKYRQLILDGFNAPVLGNLRVSLSPDRSAPLNLARTSLTGNVYIFFAPPAGMNVYEVEFYLDGALFTTEGTGPWDLMGGSVAAATALDTSTLSRSVHTLKAVVTTMEWKTVTESATFSLR